MVDKLFQVGGLLRVRAVLAIGMTVIGGIYMLVNQAMPPDGYAVLWTAAVLHYFATRAPSTE